MTSSAEARPREPVGAGLAGPTSEVGAFRFWFAGQRWEWSDEVARMHGYEPGAVTPTTELLLSHKHPEDRAHVEDLLDRALHSGGSFSSRHRFIDTAGREHKVLVVADRMLDADGTVAGTSGYYIDITHTLDETRREALSAALPELLEARAVIEQAKGALMAIYQITAEQAFRILVWRSQETNIKLRVLAGRLMSEVDSAAFVDSVTRSQFDHLLLTVHERIAAEA
ncbi:PAS and ANTAR domain-containing protein [Nocardia sp. NPDC088792]|uniref:PAS and ANTAR domain-containing protein n=1 Tax=Nocardia sp. NPDC088792 TaxID=3364332 RepID=UPI00381F25E3